jgi:hypothetical protein
MRREVGAGAVGTRGAPRSCTAPGGGRRSRGDTWRPRSCLEPGGGSRSHGDMWWPRSCHELGGGYHSTAPLPCPSAHGQGVVMPVTSPDNLYRMITQGKTGFRVVADRLVLIAATSSPTPSLIPSSARAALPDPHWRAAMEEEYRALISNGIWELVPDIRAPTLSPISGSSHTSSVLTGPLIATRPVRSFGVSLGATESTTMRPSACL